MSPYYLCCYLNSLYYHSSYRLEIRVMCCCVFDFCSIGSGSGNVCWIVFCFLVQTLHHTNTLQSLPWTWNCWFHGYCCPKIEISSHVQHILDIMQSLCLSLLWSMSCIETDSRIHVWYLSQLSSPIPATVLLIRSPIKLLLECLVWGPCIVCISSNRWGDFSFLRKSV